MPSGRKRLRQKMATHKRKKRLRKNRHKLRINAKNVYAKIGIKRNNHFSSLYLEL